MLVLSLHLEVINSLLLLEDLIQLDVLPSEILQLSRVLLRLQLISTFIFESEVRLEQRYFSCCRGWILSRFPSVVELLLTFDEEILVVRVISVSEDGGVAR